VTGYGENQRPWLSLRQRRWQDGLGEIFAEHSAKLPYN
jgi:hypothetical protein